jgi:hypothetical protein
MESGISNGDRKYFLTDNFCSIEPIIERNFGRGSFLDFKKINIINRLLNSFRSHKKLAKELQG